MVYPGDETSGDGASWTLLTGHGHVLVAVAKNPVARIRDLSQEAGLTERSTVAILNDLERAGYITRHHSGRRTTYTIHVDRGFRHQSQGGLQIGPFLELLTQGTDGTRDQGDVSPRIGGDRDGTAGRAPFRRSAAGQTAAGEASPA